MEKYKVKPEDLKGEIKDFPIEIVQKMVDYHIKEEGKMNRADMNALQILPDGAFNWRNTNEGLEFWGRVIHHHDFYLFFEKYPKSETSDNKEEKTNNIKLIVLSATATLFCLFLILICLEIEYTSKDFNVNFLKIIDIMFLATAFIISLKITYKNIKKYILK